MTAFGGPTEAERLRALHDDAIGDALALLADAFEPPACDYCEDGDTPIEGWHLIPDDSGWEGTSRVPCPRQP